MKKDTWLKVELYIMSLWLLFFLIILLTIDVPLYFGKDSVFIGFHSLFARNIIPIISLCLLLSGLVIAARLKFRWKGAISPSIMISKISNANFEYLTFLTTYIIPLVCIDLTSYRSAFVMLILLVVIGIIFVRMDMYLGNPTLALMGYRLYKLSIILDNRSEDIIAVTKERLKEGDYIEYIKIDHASWFVRKWVK